MYYQAESHRTRMVADADEAARIIHIGALMGFEALTWTAPNGRRLAAVSDGGINNPWGEVAVIQVDVEPPVQIESITFGWIDDIETKARYLRECETTDFFMWQTSLPLDGQGEEKPARFTCGCCGEGFVSSISQQKKYDKDAGFGMCQRCARF